MSLLAHENLPPVKLKKKQETEPTAALIIILMTGGWAIPVFILLMIMDWAEKKFWKK